MSQAELGALIGVSDVMVSRYETGNSTPSADKAWLLHKVTGLPFILLCFPDGPPVLERKSRKDS